MLTPYAPRVHRQFLPFFRNGGFEVTSDATFNLESDWEIGELTTESILEASRFLAGPTRVDALFISCTAISIVSDIDELEGALDLPVVTSSQALAWDVLRLMGYKKPIEGFGRLLRRIL